MLVSLSRLGVAVTVVGLLAPSPQASCADELTVPIVYASREFNDGATAGGPVVRARVGSLRVRTPDGNSHAIVDAAAVGAPAGAPVDVSDPDVSWDASHIVFSGYSEADQAWRIFEVQADGTELKQLTTSNRRISLDRYGEAAAHFGTYDDVDPCYLPDGRVCFVSTRYPGVAPSNRARTTNLYVVNTDGSDLHRITTERFGADTPAVDPTSGEIVYSRWWLTAQEFTPPSGGENANRPPVYYGPTVNPNNFSSTVLRGIADADYKGVNVWTLSSIHPDGSGLRMTRGYGLLREFSMAYRPAFLSDGSLIAQFIRESPVLGVPGNNGLRGLPAADALPIALGGPQDFQGGALLPDPNPGNPQRGFEQPVFSYSSAAALPDGRLIVTGRIAIVPGISTGIFVQTIGEGVPQLVLDTSPANELDAVALASRSKPPILADVAPRLQFEEAPRDAEEAKRNAGTFTFVAENVFANGPVDLRIAGAPPFGRGLQIEFYMNPQREGVTQPEPPILLGTRDIGFDGRVEMELPAGVPLFEVLRWRDGRIGVGRDGQAFHVGGMNFGVAGARARCVGCHSGHSLLQVGDAPAWTNLAPSALVTANSVREMANGFGTFHPALLADRLTDRASSEWAASDANAPGRPGEAPRPIEVTFRWIQPILASSITVYAPQQGASVFGGDRTISISGLTVSTLMQDVPVASKRVLEAVQPTGTAIAWNAAELFDVLKIQIAPDDFTGLYEGLAAPALAEVEVFGRVAGDDPPTFHLARGDTDCDSRVNITDAVVLLDTLFRSGGRLCCAESADINSDTLINISDPIFLLAAYFAGGDPPQGGFKCAPTTGGALGCETESEACE